jgi:hypothetical protein
MSSSFASLLLLAMPAPALACARDEATLFSCTTTDVGKSVALCAVRDDAAGGYQSLQYRYGAEDAPELVFPEDRGEGRAAMAFAHAFDRDIYVWSLRFSNRGYTYRVFARGDDAGVEVWKKNKLLASVACAERPYARPADIRKAASCDRDNPFGAAGCSENAPARR